MEHTLTLADHLVHAAIDLAFVGLLYLRFRKHAKWAEEAILFLGKRLNVTLPTPPPLGRGPTLGGLE